MKRERSNWLIFGSAVAALFITMAAGIAYGQNLGTSIEDRSANISFTHVVPMDSGRAFFSYPTTANIYYDVKLLPNLALSKDSTTIYAAPALDSLGTHVVRVTFWETGDADTSGFGSGIWVHDWSDGITRRLNGYGIGAFSREDEYAEADTLFLGYWTNATTHVKTHFEVLYHPGGSPGGDPDSSRTFDIADR